MFDELREKKKAAGARHFVDLPLEFAFFDEFYEHTEKLEGVEITEFMVDGIVDMWLEFDFQDHKFSVTNQFTDYCFYVDDGGCPEQTLMDVIGHFRLLVVESGQ